MSFSFRSWKTIRFIANHKNFNFFHHNNLHNNYHNLDTSHDLSVYSGFIFINRPDIYKSMDLFYTLIIFLQETS